MAKFYTNENFPLAGVARLRELGHDVLTSLDAGNANRSVPDSEVLDFAKTCARTVLTRNRRDFRRLHANAPDHCGIVLCSDEADFVGQAERIHREVTLAGDLQGKLLQVTKPHPT